jgi:hypothetical protein
MAANIKLGPFGVLDQTRLTERSQCLCAAAKDLSQGKGPERHIYCPTCGKHVYKGIEWTKKHWEWWIETTNLTKEQAVEVMRAGHKVRHRYFEEHEWVTMWGDRMVIDETLSKISFEEFWGPMRDGLAWNDDWTIVS